MEEATKVTYYMQKETLKQKLMTMVKSKKDECQKKLTKYGYFDEFNEALKGNLKDIDDTALTILCNCAKYNYNEAVFERNLQREGKSINEYINETTDNLLNQEENQNGDFKDDELNSKEDNQEENNQNDNDNKDNVINIAKVNNKILTLDDFRSDTPNLSVHVQNLTPSLVRKLSIKDNITSNRTSFELPNVIPLNGNKKEYMIIMTLKEIAELWLDEKICYNPDFQRGAKRLKSGEERAIYTPNKIDEISKNIKEETYFTDMITWCFLKEKDSEFKYDADKGILRFTGNAFILDGQHRTRSIYKCFIEKLQNPDVQVKMDYEFIVKIGNYNETEAKKAFVQMAKATPINKVRKAALENDNYTDVVNYINRNSDLSKKINYNNTSTGSKFLVDFNTLRDAVKAHTTVGMLDVEEVGQYLCDFFNTLVKEFPNYFGDNMEKVAEMKKVSMLNQNMMFDALVAVATADKEHYKENIEKLKKIDFSKSNMVWRQGLKLVTGATGDISDANIDISQLAIRSETNTRKFLSDTLLDLLANVD